MDSQLFSPLTIRGVTLKNRIVLSPMLQYCATNGHLNEWHFMHYGKYAAGGTGLVFVESTKVDPRGCSTPRDLGLWMRKWAKKGAEFDVAAHKRYAHRIARTERSAVGGLSGRLLRARAHRHEARIPERREQATRGRRVEPRHRERRGNWPHQRADFAAHAEHVRHAEQLRVEADNKIGRAHV